jgi:quercetin dioxygenase-like cupin family protein
MTQNTQKLTQTCNFFVTAIAGAAFAVASAGAQASPNEKAPVYRSPGGAMLKLLLDERNVGDSITVGELTFPPNSDSGDHLHGAIEVLYVISGELEHSVNGKMEKLTAGMIGYVKPPDKIRHKTGPAGAKVLVVWVPGAEGKRIAARWTREP